MFLSFKRYAQPAALVFAMLLVLTCNGCSTLTGFLGSSVGQTVAGNLLAGLGSTIVGFLESKYGISPAQVNGVVNQLAAVDSAEPANMLQIGSVVQAHASNVSGLNQAVVTNLLAAINATIATASANDPSLAKVQLTSTQLLQAIATASQPNLTPTTASSHPVAYRERLNGRLVVVNPVCLPPVYAVAVARHPATDRHRARVLRVAGDPGRDAASGGLIRGSLSTGALDPAVVS